MPKANRLLDELSLAILDDEPTTISDEDILNFIERNLWIVDKDNASRIIRFKLNFLQRSYWQQHTDYDYILKARKGGFSTLIMAEGFARACLLPNQQIVFLAHRKESADLIFQTMHRFYNSLSAEWKDRLSGGKASLKTQSKSHIGFTGNDSQIIAMAASAPDALRGMTPTFVHNSETAFWKPEWAADSLSSILASIPPGGVARIETTPSSVASYAYEEWHRAVVRDSRFEPFFFPWWDDPTNIEKSATAHDIEDLTQDEALLMNAHDLTPQQIAWRRLKIKEQGIRKFKREYPEDSEQCWTRAGATVFDMERVARAFGGIEPRGQDELGLIIHEDPEPGHTYIIGADPAGGSENGDFSAAICLDETTGHEAFSYLGRLPIHEFAEHLHEWGMQYGEAALAIERNNHGHAVIQYLTLENSYPYLFVDDDGKLGILTTQKSKALMISVLDRFFADGDFLLQSRNLYRQLSAYVYDDHDRASGGQGAGVDDLVAALLCSSYALNINHPKGIVEGTPQEANALKVPESIQSLDEQTAVKYSMMHMMASLGLPYHAENPMEREGAALPQVGCECGSLKKRLVNGIWVCSSCGKAVGHYGASSILL